MTERDFNSRYNFGDEHIPKNQFCSWEVGADDSGPYIKKGIWSKQHLSVRRAKELVAALQQVVEFMEQGSQFPVFKIN